MFAYLLLLIITIIKHADCDLEITDAGILPIQEDDMAITFYLTLKNQCDRNVEVSVGMNQCCDQSKPDETNCNMYLLGGYMGILKMKETKNVTLIHPTLYSSYRKGTCSLSVTYRNAKFERVLTKVVDYKTNNNNEDRHDLCPSCDTDPRENCNQVDCVIKYFGEKSYFNPTSKECELVPTCLSDPQRDPFELIGYSWLTNECMNLNNSISKYDLEYLENNQADISDNDMLLLNNVICHHGEMGSTGECLCGGTWRTSLFEDDVYEPSLFLYHMCNIEPGGWNCVNRNRIEATALIVAILSFTIATKVLILMCILNWCYRHFKKQKHPLICTENPDEFNKSFIMSDYSKETSFGCICSDLKKTRFPKMVRENVDISYYSAGKDSTQYSVKSETAVNGKCPDYSINLSNTTSSSTGQSFETETDVCTCTETTDYEIDFSGEEEAICSNVCQKEGQKEDETATGEDLETSKKESLEKRKLRFDKEESSEKPSDNI